MMFYQSFEQKERRKRSTLPVAASTVPVWTLVKCRASALSALPTPSQNTVRSISQSTLPTKCTDRNFAKTKKVSLFWGICLNIQDFFVKIKVLREEKEVTQIGAFPNKQYLYHELLTLKGLLLEANTQFKYFHTPNDKTMQICLLRKYLLSNQFRWELLNNSL